MHYEHFADNFPGTFPIAALANLPHQLAYEDVRSNQYGNGRTRALRKSPQSIDNDRCQASIESFMNLSRSWSPRVQLMWIRPGFNWLFKDWSRGVVFYGSPVNYTLTSPACYGIITSITVQGIHSRSECVRLVRILLADPLEPEQSWEKVLTADAEDRRALYIRYSNSLYYGKTRV